MVRSCAFRFLEKFMVKKEKNPVVNDCMLLRVMTQYHVAEKSYLFISQFFQPFLFLCFALLLTLLE